MSEIGAGTGPGASTHPTPAVVLANGHFTDSDAKTAHGLVRGSRRFEVVGVVDAACAGADAGELLDGHARSIPISASLADAVAKAAKPPLACVIGVATEGGVLPDELRRELLHAADHGMQLVNGLHQLLANDEELVARCRASGAEIVDIRRPRHFSELSFWSGRIRQLEIPRIALLGTDCALGKRTTAGLLLEALRARSVSADLVFTGQTGWLQGFDHGFIFDATPNDFVSGELERAAARMRTAKAIPTSSCIEGQAALRNPSGPCGSEMIVLSAGALPASSYNTRRGARFFEDSRRAARGRLARFHRSVRGDRADPAPTARGVPGRYAINDRRGSKRTATARCNARSIDARTTWACPVLHPLKGETLDATGGSDRSSAMLDEQQTNAERAGQESE